MILRPAGEGDCEFFLHVRQSADGGSTLTWSDHTWWWDENPDHELRCVILAPDGERAGVLRMSRPFGRVSIALLPAYRGKGLGTEALRALIPFAREAGIRRLTAEIGFANHASFHAFTKAGYRERAWLLDYRP